uniref:ATP-binding protein n=1 Tax=Ningiella ruwaisensis TaxID=2364274 RepID=UPI0010A02746|nr:ATP-binding protein [Ningiella ruwaisensis]
MHKSNVYPFEYDNSENIRQAMSYLREVIQARCKLSTQTSADAQKLPSLTYVDDQSVFAHIIRSHQPQFHEYIFLLCAIAIECEPYLFEQELATLAKHPEPLLRFAEASNHHSAFFVPSVETAIYLVAGNDLTSRLRAMKSLLPTHWLFQNNLLQSINETQPVVQQQLRLHPQFYQALIQGHQHSDIHLPDNMPARLLETQKAWEDLVVNESTQARIEDLLSAILHGNTLRTQWKMQHKLMPGYRTLFYGPSGTGKTLAASLIGKHCNKPVYRVDLSMVVSKYIGETEKNLKKLFDIANDQAWILFFDEADALFGKRTAVKDAHDRFANQEVSYLLQRIEQYPGITILATNFKGNMDEAFVRRFNTIVAFHLPDEAQRRSIWQRNLPPNYLVADENALLDSVQKHALSGGSIVNAIEHACLKALTRGKDAKLSVDDCLAGVMLETEKLGKVFQA